MAVTDSLWGSIVLRELRDRVEREKEERGEGGEEEGVEHRPTSYI